MKTAMQILVSELNEGLAQDEIKVSPKELLQNLIWRCEGLLEKEKEQRMEAWCSGYDSYDEDISGDSPLEYYNKTFNTKER